MPMISPTKVAENTMNGFFASRGERWPAVEAGEIISRIRLRRDHHWEDKSLVSCASDVLARAFFPVDELIRLHLGITIEYDDLTYLDRSEGCRVLGCAYPNSKEIVICRRVTKYKPLFRTTAAHELGHILMHADHSQRCMLFTPDRLASTPEEQEANAFMQAIILPNPVLKLGIGYICHLYGINMRLTLDAANNQRGRWIWQKWLFPHLINMLCVSRQMITIKMKQWGWFDEATVNHHKTYALETRWHTPQPREHIQRPLRKVMVELLRNINPDGFDTSTQEVSEYNPDDYLTARSQTVMRG